MLMNCPIDLPDETLTRSRSDVSRKVTFSDGLTTGKKLLDTPKIPVKTDRDSPTRRLQECVGRAHCEVENCEVENCEVENCEDIIGSSEFQVEPKIPRGTRRGHKEWRSMAPALAVT